MTERGLGLPPAPRWPDRLRCGTLRGEIGLAAPATGAGAEGGGGGRVTEEHGPGGLPEYLRVRAQVGPNYRRTKELLRGATLHSVCEEAHCPNIFECFERRTATFLILGRVCTWNCRYCAVTSGRPAAVDEAEPQRLAETVARLGLRYVVITSVTRDDLPDGGARIFARCIEAVRAAVPGCRVEVLTPDFAGSVQALETVLEARPDVFNHNIETVRRVFHRARPKGDYDRSLRLLGQAHAAKPDIPVKSGFMVGLGETFEEIEATMADLRDAGCSIVTAGQYLRPSLRHMAVSRFYTPEEYGRIREIGRRLGLHHVEAGPLVRSSYHAREQAADLVPETDAASPLAAGAGAEA
jgi:lipoic acid synthetase